MKKIFNFTLLAALFAILFTACDKEDPFPGDSDGTGQLSIKKMIVKIENEENVVRSSIDVGSFLVDILKDGEVVDSYVYSEMPEVVTLPVGHYTVKVRSGELQDVAWETPYFEGSQEFDVAKKEITEVETVVCKLSNVRVTIIFDDALKQAMGDDAKVHVVMGEGASIDFAKAETRSAYFAYAEGSNTLVATFSGSIAGGAYEEFKAYTDVKPGNHYKITYAFHNGTVPGTEGSITFNGVNVDAHVEESDLTFNVDPGEDDIIPGGDRPSQGGDNPPTPPEPGNGPTLTIPSGSSISFDNVVDAVDGKQYTLDITSETGFTVFTVDIESDYLTPEMLQGVQLGSHLDLINPGSLQAGIESLGLPCNVGGQKSATFDISAFVPLLSLGENGQIHTFVLKVGDASGTVTKSMKFRTVNK